MPEIEIARALGRPRQSVRYATDPGTRERQKANVNRHRKPTDEEAKKRKAYRVREDHKRLTARRIARERWREAGSKGSLTPFYRALDCL